MKIYRYGYMRMEGCMKIARRRKRKKEKEEVEQNEMCMHANDARRRNDREGRRGEGAKGRWGERKGVSREWKREMQRGRIGGTLVAHCTAPHRTPL